MLPQVSPKRAVVTRGMFILFEGVDRCGKTTQSKSLVEHLKREQERATWMNFPNRQTKIGQMIDQYLKSEVEMDDHAIHLLFSANRWESQARITSSLAQGEHVVMDRWIYSGLAFSAAKGMDLDWCGQSDVGLPVPDLIIYLAFPSSSSSGATSRQDFGAERYETSAFQQQVAQYFDQLVKSSIKSGNPWVTLDASKDIGTLEGQVQTLVRARRLTLSPDVGRFAG